MQFCLPINEGFGMECSFFENTVEIAMVNLEDESRESISIPISSFEYFIELLNQIRDTKNYVENELASKSS